VRILVMFLLVLVSSPAFAHGLELFVNAEGNDLIGSVTYDDEKVVTGAKVIVYNDHSEELTTLTTDAEGMFRYARVDDGTVHFKVTTADGHSISYEGSDAEEEIEEYAHDHGDGDEDSDLHHEMEHLLDREIGKVREDIYRLEHTTRFHDVVGGIGYIVGVLGIIAFMKARKG
jgi:nickel transport protein